VHGYDNSILDDTHAEIRRVHCIDSDKEELKITSSLNCLGYIEFDFVCDLVPALCGPTYQWTSV
jgi:hypothetical protein